MVNFSSHFFLKPDDSSASPLQLSRRARARVGVRALLANTDRHWENGHGEGGTKRCLDRVLVRVIMGRLCVRSATEGMQSFLPFKCGRIGRIRVSAPIVYNFSLLVGCCP